MQLSAVLSRGFPLVARPSVTHIRASLLLGSTLGWKALCRSLRLFDAAAAAAVRRTVPPSAAPRRTQLPSAAARRPLSPSAAVHLTLPPAPTSVVQPCGHIGASFLGSSLGRNPLLLPSASRRRLLLSPPQPEVSIQEAKIFKSVAGLGGRLAREDAPHR